MEPVEELLRRCGRGSGDILVCSGMQARKYVVAEVAEGYANHSRGYHQDRGHVRARPSLNVPEPTSRVNNYQQRPMQDFRKRNMDYRYQNQVAAVEQNQAPAQRPRFDGPRQWPPRNDYPRKQYDGQKKWQPRQKLTYEEMLDQPCSHHSALIGRPSDHSNRNCAWTLRMTKGDGILPPPPADRKSVV